MDMQKKIFQRSDGDSLEIVATVAVVTIFKRWLNTSSCKNINLSPLGFLSLDEFGKKLAVFSDHVRHQTSFLARHVQLIALTPPSMLLEPGVTASAQAVCEKPAPGKEGKDLRLFINIKILANSVMGTARGIELVAREFDALARFVTEFSVDISRIIGYASHWSDTHEQDTCPLCVALLRAPLRCSTLKVANLNEATLLTDKCLRSYFGRHGENIRPKGRLIIVVESKNDNEYNSCK